MNRTKYQMTILMILISGCSSNNFSKSYNKNDSLYLDYAASPPVNIESLNEFITISCMDGNSSGINIHSKLLKNIELHSEQIIAQKINANSSQIHFANNASSANNAAILGVAYKNPGCHLITSKIEHKSILSAFRYLETKGYKVTYVDTDKYGNVNLDQLRNSITNNTKLISIQMFNSEIGTLQNIKEIGNIAKKYNILFHSDAAQSFCKYDIDVDDMNIDLLTLSGYKIGSPKGIAALYIRDSSRLKPIMFGSGDRFFPGTKPTALIASFAKSVETFCFSKEKITHNYNTLVSELSKIEKIYFNSKTPSHVVSIAIEGVLLNDIFKRMNNYSFSAGCSCLGQDKSNVIAAIDPNDKLPSCIIRISFSDKTEEKLLIDFAKKLKQTIDQLRKEKNVGKGCQSVI